MRKYKMKTQFVIMLNSEWKFYWRHFQYTIYITENFTTGFLRKII